jgi:NADH-quinone oxidoreductase subunit G
MLAEPLQTYVLFGVEPQYDFADGAAAMRALAGAQIIAFSAFASDQLKQIAKVILPIGLLPEIEATLTNLDGTEQTSAAGGKLPGQARSGWRILRALIETMALPDFDFTDIAGLRARVRADAALSGDGISVKAAPSSGLERIVSTPIYRSDAVLRRATALNAHPLTVGARAVMNPEDAQARGLAEGAVAKIGDGTGTAALPVAISSSVPKGAVWIESGYAATAPLSPTAALEVTGA